MSVENNYCKFCNAYVPDGTVHNCQPMPLPPLPSIYNYRCPDCGGEFTEPALEQGVGTYACYKCPFCGREMTGLGGL